MISNDIKTRIVLAISGNRQNYATDAKHAVALGISTSVYSEIKKGNTEQKLSDAKWMSIARRLGVSLDDGAEWKIVKTPTFEYLTSQLELCRAKSLSGMFCDIPNIGTTHADYFHEAIPCTADMTEEEVKGAYEMETGNVIVKRFEGMNPVHTPGVLVKNHGPFSWGKDAHDAVHNAVVMEQVAKMASIAYAVNPNLTMNPLLVEKHFSRKHGPNAYYGQKK